MPNLTSKYTFIQIIGDHYTSPAAFLAKLETGKRAIITMVDQSQYQGVTVERSEDGWALIAYERTIRTAGGGNVPGTIILGKGKVWIQTSHILTIDFHDPAPEPKAEEAKEEKAAE